MAFLPILIEMENMPCLVAGGGAIALHKVEKLLEHGADVTVVAPEICREIQDLPVKVCKRCAEASDCEGMALVADATGDRDAEDLLSDACAKLHIPYICAGRGELCTAILPAVYSSGRTLVAVSSKGASPAASAWLRDYLAEKVPENMDAILDRMADVRRIAKDSLQDQPVRREFMHDCLKKMTDTGEIISDAEINKMLKKYL
jgi:siroheme synthase-like protein